MWKNGHYKTIPEIYIAKHAHTYISELNISLIRNEISNMMIKINIYSITWGTVNVLLAWNDEYSFSWKKSHCETFLFAHFSSIFLSQEYNRNKNFTIN
jgi:hypothetical protein